MAVVEYSIDLEGLSSRDKNDLFLRCFKEAYQLVKIVYDGKPPRKITSKRERLMIVGVGGLERAKVSQEADSLNVRIVLSAAA